MKYMLLIYHDEQAWDALTERQKQDIYLEYRTLVQDLESTGKFLAGDELQAGSTATTLTVRDGKQLVTDGPFAETREQLGGFFLVEVKDANEAMAIAARIPSARTGTIEVRPVAENTAAVSA